MARWIIGIQTDDAMAAYSEVHQFAGANKVRVEVDKRIINEVKTGKEVFGATYEGGKNGIIDFQVDVGGLPKLASLPPPSDSDRDGMPDSWELEYDLDPKVPDSDKNTLDKQYTNIEVYIHSLVA